MFLVTYRCNAIRAARAHLAVTTNPEYIDLHLEMIDTWELEVIAAADAEIARLAGASAVRGCGIGRAA